MRKTNKKPNKSKKQKYSKKNIRRFRPRNKKRYQGGGIEDITVFSKRYTSFFSKSSIREAILRPDISQHVLKTPVDEIKSLSTGILNEIVSSSTYSLLPYYFLDENIGIGDQDEIVSKQNSGNCVSFAHMVLDKLNNLGISGVIIPATLPPRLIQSGYPLYGHVATLLQTEDYFIIFEPAYFIMEPIVVNKNGEITDLKVNVFNAVWKLSYDNKDMKINVTMDGKPLFYYKMSTIENPSESVSYPINILNKRIPTVKYDNINNRKIAHFSIRVDTQVLEGYNIKHTSEDQWYSRFEWKTCLENKELPVEEQVRILADWEGLCEMQCSDLGYMDRNELIEKVYSIIKIEWEKNKTAALFGGSPYEYEKTHWI